MRNSDGFGYGITLRQGTEGGSVLADLTVPNKVMMKTIFNFDSTFNPNWYLQLFSGYGEDLLMYNQKRNVVRLGIKFIM